MKKSASLTNEIKREILVEAYENAMKDKRECYFPISNTRYKIEKVIDELVIQGTVKTDPTTCTDFAFIGKHIQGDSIKLEARQTVKFGEDTSYTITIKEVVRDEE